MNIRSYYEASGYPYDQPFILLRFSKCMAPDQVIPQAGAGKTSQFTGKVNLKRRVRQI